MSLYNIIKCNLIHKYKIIRKNCSLLKKRFVVVIYFLLIENLTVIIEIIYENFQFQSKLILLQEHFN